jgi:2-desacetyl-2-hydroxyethyl bacteriochlorophyllide A dehydrogenase
MATDHARAFWIAAPGHGEIRTEALPAPRDGEVLVRTLYSGISRGTEALVFHGLVPGTEYERMRAPFQVGSFPAPVKYGYSSVGEVEHGPPHLLGQRVFVLFPHQTRYVVPGGAVHLLPPDVPPARAVLAANMETAVNGLWDATPRVGDRVTIIGAGTVGCLVAWLATKIVACDVELVDINPQRATTAKRLGVRFAPPHEARENADVVVHASGAASGLATALRLAAFEATVIEMSWYGSQPVMAPLGEAFHARRLTLRSSQVGHVATSQRARWDTFRRMQLALSLLRDPVLDTLITGESDFETLPELMVELASAAGDTLCHRIRYSSSFLFSPSS